MTGMKDRHKHLREPPFDIVARALAPDDEPVSKHAKAEGNGVGPVRSAKSIKHNTAFSYSPC